MRNTKREAMEPVRSATLLLLAICGLGLVYPVQAEDDPHAAHKSPPAVALNEASAAFEAANAKMHKDMAVHLTGDADQDFVMGMIPHHQGAVDMAQIVLRFGKDPEVRKLAEEVIKAQETEIAFMKSWLAKNSP